MKGSKMTQFSFFVRLYLQSQPTNENFEKGNYIMSNASWELCCITKKTWFQTHYNGFQHKTHFTSVTWKLFVMQQIQREKHYSKYLILSTRTWLLSMLSRVDFNASVSLDYVWPLTASFLRLAATSFGSFVPLLWIVWTNSSFCVSQESNSSYKTSTAD